MFGRFYIQYLYQETAGWKKEGNLGDGIQNIAVENIYKKIGIQPQDLILINRDDMPNYQGDNVELVMQSYFANLYNTFPFPWSKDITPIFLGMHLSPIHNFRQLLIKRGILKLMKPFEPIGCRDRNTRNFLKSHGINAYFSGCMSLTLDKRPTTPQNGKVFIVDLYSKALQDLPKHIKDIADYSITHIYQWKKDQKIDFESAMQFEQKAREILNTYKEQASLVITSRIHVAMPCIAMGIPVIFIAKNLFNARYDVLQGIVPIYSYKDIKYIDWNPAPANIDILKEAILSNAIAQITKSDDRYRTIEKLNEITSKLKPISYLPWHRQFFRNLHTKLREIFHL